jgi:hypothetical protein
MHARRFVLAPIRNGSVFSLGLETWGRNPGLRAKSQPSKELMVSDRTIGTKIPSEGTSCRTATLEKSSREARKARGDLIASDEGHYPDRQIFLRGI